MSVACSSAASTSPTVDAGGSGGDVGVPGEVDANTVSRSCVTETQCPTAMRVTFGNVEEPLTRAQFGFNKKAPTLHLEMHAGGDPACPVEKSPTPDRTLIIEDFPTEVTGKLTGADGVRAAFLDFKGTLTTTPILKAQTLRITNVRMQLEPRATSFVAFDFEATFEGGKVSGQSFVSHCDSMDSI